MGGFSEMTLRVAHDLMATSGDCIHDQSILNALHLHRAERGYSGLSPMMNLPCSWMLIPSAVWQLHWNSPEKWLPEISARHRYPGFVSVEHFEVYCPDVVDLLSPWAFHVATQDASRRLRESALKEASRTKRYCTNESVDDSSHTQCCECGRR